MLERIQEYAQIGVVHCMLFPELIRGIGPIVDTVQGICSDPYFESIEVTWIRDIELRRKARDFMHAANFAIAYTAQPPILVNKIDLCSDDEKMINAGLLILNEAIVEAKSIGTDEFILLSGADPGDELREAARERFKNVLRSIIQMAAKQDNMKVTLELYDRNPKIRNRLYGPTSESVELAQEMRKDYPNFGLALDLSHLFLIEEDPREALLLAKDYLHRVHISTCVLNPTSPLFGDEHPTFTAPGSAVGIPQLSTFLKNLLEIGYLSKEQRRPLLFEIKPWGHIPPSVVLAEAKRALDHAWAMVE